MLHLHIKEYDTYTTGICRGLKIPDTEHKGAPVSIRKKDITYFTDFIVHIRNSRDLEVWETHDEILKQWEGSHVL